jgi:hypothetical protein
VSSTGDDDDWHDADEPPGPYVIIGQYVYLKFVVTNKSVLPQVNTNETPVTDNGLPYLTGVIVHHFPGGDMGGPEYGVLGYGEVWETRHRLLVTALGLHYTYGVVVAHAPEIQLDEAFTSFDIFGNDEIPDGMIFDYDLAYYFGVNPPEEPDQKPSASAAGFLPDKFNLTQNHPNPFNPITTIGYDLPQSSHVTFRIHDVLGNEVITLIDQEMPAGRHSVSWNATNKFGSRVASGIYFYTIQTTEFKATKKLMVIE